MNATEAVYFIRDRATAKSPFAIEYNQIADLIETLVRERDELRRERDEARERMLTDDEIYNLETISAGMIRGETFIPNGPSSRAIERIVTRLRPEPITWTRTGTTSVMVFKGVTYTVYPNHDEWFSFNDQSGVGRGPYPSREDAEAAAEKHARENHRG